jgi:hypothetical protein
MNQDLPVAQVCRRSLPAFVFLARHSANRQRVDAVHIWSSDFRLIPADICCSSCRRCRHRDTFGLVREQRCEQESYPRDFSLHQGYESSRPRNASSDECYLEPPVRLPVHDNMPELAELSRDGRIPKWHDKHQRGGRLTCTPNLGGYFPEWSRLDEQECL